jgi:hypothetical protein
MRFLPKERKFFDLFDMQVEKLMQAAALLNKLRKRPQDIKKIAVQIKQLEVEADSIGHQVVDGLHQTFITPLERDDIDILRQDLDDIMDGIEQAVNRLVLYNIPVSTFSNAIIDYFLIIEKAIIEIKQGVTEIRNLKKYSHSLSERCEKINKLEDEGDEINRKALGKLMNPKRTSAKNNLEIMKRKEIYDTLEDTIDRCEDVGNILESILIKNM